MRLSLTLLFIFVTVTASAADLDGRQFTVTMNDGKRDLPAEQLEFADGKLGAPAIRERYGFADTPYTCTRIKAGAEIAATFTSTKHGQLVITGTVAQDGSISGTRTWSKPDKQPIVHTFTGAVVKP